MHLFCRGRIDSLAPLPLPASFFNLFNKFYLIFKIHLMPKLLKCIAYV